MAFDSSQPGSPTPLQPASADRVNQQGPDSFSSARGQGHSHGHSRDGSVTDKINQFNTLAQQSRQLERKTADAALKRAMLGREEAESEMRRYRDEARALRRQVEEGKERERRVGERLETVMENYGRAKETHAHTQALWEKEIRRARKETFKSQSVIVKLQEELKSARASLRTTEEMLEREKERSRSREQEAFQARYELVGCQSQLEEALERVRVLEQERDAFKSLARSEEDVAKIAAEGRLPLPPSDPQNEEDDEFASPRKRRGGRASSLTPADVRSSAASEAEIDELTRLWQWERQRADRAAELVEYLEAECHLRACSCMKKRPRSNTAGSSTSSSSRKRLALDPDEGADMTVVGEEPEAPAAAPQQPTMSATAKIRARASMTPKKKHQLLDEDGCEARPQPRRSTIFVPEEGVFRTVSQQEAEAMGSEAIISAAETEAEAEAEAETGADDSGTEPPTPVENEEDATTTPSHNHSHFCRTPSVEPPSFAVLSQQRTSLLSLLDAPHRAAAEPPLTLHIPTTPGPQPGPTIIPVSASVDEQADRAQVQVAEMMEVDVVEVQVKVEFDERHDISIATAVTAPETQGEEMEDGQEEEESERETISRATTPQEPVPSRVSELEPQPQEEQEEEGEQDEGHTPHADVITRPHTSAAFYSIKTTTTKVPLREENMDPSLAQRILAAQRTPTHSNAPRKAFTTPRTENNNNNCAAFAPSFDVNNPAMTPTMTREQALAQIRERRGRARSAASAATGAGGTTCSAYVTPRKPSGGTGAGKAERRDLSAPVVASGAGRGVLDSARRVRS